MFRFEPEKALESLVYVASRVPGHDMYKTLKVLYVADKLHLAKYGRLIYGEHHYALPYGPVPQHAYDAVKSLQALWVQSLIPKDQLAGALKRDHTTLHPLREADLDELSKSDVDCLNEALRECEKLSMDQIKELTHDSAWQATDRGQWMTLDKIIDALPEDRREAVREYRKTFLGTDSQNPEPG